MNKKIYFNTSHILITAEKIQHSENQLIVDVAREGAGAVKNHLTTFLQQAPQKNLALYTSAVNDTLELVKARFTCISAAGGLIRNKSRYLFIFRLGKWDLPKGKLEAGETPAQAALRECEEECSISGLHITGELPPTFHIYPYQNDYALKTTWWYAMQSEFSGTLIPQTEEHIEKAEWLEPEEAQEIVVKNSYPAILDVMKAGMHA